MVLFGVIKMGTKKIYEDLLEESQCWRSFKNCPCGKPFLRDLYNWTNINSLNPILVWKICDPCENKKLTKDNIKCIKKVWKE